MIYVSYNIVADAVSVRGVFAEASDQWCELSSHLGEEPYRIAL